MLLDYYKNVSERAIIKIDVHFSILDNDTDYDLKSFSRGNNLSILLD